MRPTTSSYTLLTTHYTLLTTHYLPHTAYYTPLTTRHLPLLTFERVAPHGVERISHHQIDAARHA